MEKLPVAGEPLPGSTHSLLSYFAWLGRLFDMPKADTTALTCTRKQSMQHTSQTNMCLRNWRQLHQIFTSMKACAAASHHHRHTNTCALLLLTALMALLDSLHLVPTSWQLVELSPQPPYGVIKTSIAGGAWYLHVSVVLASVLRVADCSMVPVACICSRSIVIPSIKYQPCAHVAVRSVCPSSFRCMDTGRMDCAFLFRRVPHIKVFDDACSAGLLDVAVLIHCLDLDGY